MAPVMTLDGLKAVRETWLRSYGKTVLAAFERRDAEHPVFWNCWDWHSSAHGHWALVRLAVALEDPLYLEPVQTSLEKGDIPAEAVYLREHPDFEMPYGRAWFLKLAREYASATGSRRLTAFADDVATSLMAYMANRTFDPTVDEYKSQSWLLRNLAEYAGWREDGGRIAEVRDIALTAAKQRLTIEADIAHPGFFSTWGLLAHLFTLIMEPEEFRDWYAVQLEHGALDGGAPIPKAVNAHQLAINHSRAWSFASAYRLTRDPMLLDQYLRHVEVGYTIHEAYKDDYKAYGHWVSQFAIYALTEDFDALSASPQR